MAKILIVDDDVQLRQTIKMVLKLRGYDALEADDGAGALAVAQSEFPDLIISDINMPGQDGLTALKQLREDPKTATIPMILMTGEMDSNMRKGMELGADDFLTKPFAMPELLNAINARLEKKNAVQQAAEKKLSELRENISLMLPHELNTPLVGILGFGEIIYSCADTLKTAELKEMGKNILESGQRLQKLIQNFLVFSQLQMVSVDPNETEAMRNKITDKVKTVVTLAARAAAEAAKRDEDLRDELTEGCTGIAEDLLSKVIEELCGNAFKFSSRGTPVIISNRVEHDTLIIEVRDEGRGMKPEHIASIDAYVQFDRKMHEQQGSGLGLAICKMLAEIHGGSLRITSELGKGTTSAFCLPVRQLPAAPQPAAAG
ncbi:MAG: hybrid sensor histidine kinase/response regulator [Limisphaerales bacterium]